MAHEYLGNGINVIIEQGMSRAEVEALQKIAETHNADFFVYRLEASRSITDERAAKRHAELNKPLIPKETLDELYKIHEENDYSNTAVLHSGKLSTREMADNILKDLKLVFFG